MTTMSRWIPARLLQVCFLVMCLTILIVVLLTTCLEKRCSCTTEFVHPTAPVELRVLVLTHARPDSLRKCLMRLDQLIIDTGTVSQLDIWIDRRKDSCFDGDTYRISKEFRWKNGLSMVHVHNKHVGVYGQWLDTWQPVQRGQGDNDEIALFVEDDIDISPFASRWMKLVMKFYANRLDIAMFCLQDTNAVKMGANGGEVEIERDPTSPVFLYRIPGSWGCSPQPTHWRNFRTWFRAKMMDKDVTFHPYVKEARLHTGWYKIFERQNRTDSMWTMWFIYYCHAHDLYGLYSNLPRFTGLRNVSLSVNRKEAGMHFGSNRRIRNVDATLMKYWRDDFVRFPREPPKYDYNGKLLH